MKKVLILGALALAACTPKEIDDSFALACQGIPAADAVFQVYAASGKVSSTTLMNERSAVAAAQAVCDGPAPTNVSAAIQAVARAANAILKATAEAKLQAGV